MVEDEGKGSYENGIYIYLDIDTMICMWCDVAQSRVCGTIPGK